MSQIKVANVAFNTSGSTRMETTDGGANVRIVIESANVMYANPARTAFPGNLAINGTLTVAGNNVTGVTPVGGIVSITNQQVTGNTFTAVLIPLDNSIPQVGEGAEFLNVTHTPQSSTNKLWIQYLINGHASIDASETMSALFRNGAADAVYVASQFHPGDQFAASQIIGSYFTTANTTSPTIWTVRCGTELGNFVLNGISNGQSLFANTLASSITITEIKA